MHRSDDMQVERTLSGPASATQPRVGCGAAALDTTELPWWGDMTSPECRAFGEDDGIAILPTAAIEQHGGHLPLDTDLRIGLGLLRATVARLHDDVRVRVLPPLVPATSSEHAHGAGTLSIPVSLVLQQVAALGDCIAATGVRRVVFFNSHGGNVGWIEHAALDLRARLGMLAVKAHYVRLPNAAAEALTEDERRHGLHGGLLETAMMRHLHPQSVRESALAHFESTGAAHARLHPLVGPEAPVALAWMAEDLNPAGVTGDARAVLDRCHQDLGARLVEGYAASMADVLRTVQGLEWPPGAPS